MYSVKNRITVVGKSCSGKSSIIAKYQGIYQRNRVPFSYDRVNSDLKLKNNTSMKVQIVDTRGPEKFRSITNYYYLPETKAVIIVYNVREYDQKEIDYWYETSVKLNISVIAIAVFDNESPPLNDDIKARNNENAKQFAEEHNLLFKIIYWDSETEVTELFQDIGEIIHSNRKSYKGLIYVSDKTNNDKQSNKNQCYK